MHLSPTLYNTFSGWKRASSKLQCWVCLPDSLLLDFIFEEEKSLTNDGMLGKELAVALNLYMQCRHNENKNFPTRVGILHDKALQKTRIWLI